jgi:hypothetical protein
MDNTRILLANVRLNIPKLERALLAQDIDVTLRHARHSNKPNMLFSFPVGRYKCRWLFKYYKTANCLTCSGGVTKTLFGHNVWVFNNEAEQLRAIVHILTAGLSEFEGLLLPSTVKDVTIEHAELTNHFGASELGQSAAIKQLDQFFSTRYPTRRYNCLNANGEPYITGIGKQKSTRVCRAYDPCVKFDKRPEHISEEAWKSLAEACTDHIRVEIMFEKEELRRLGLDKIEGWENREYIESILDHKFAFFGLSTRYSDAIDTITPADVRSTNPTFVEAARYWFTAGQRGQPINKRSGSANRFRQFMEERGYDVNVPFAKHVGLTHGLQDILKPALRADLSIEVRRNSELFGQWWK